MWKTRTNERKTANLESGVLRVAKHRAHLDSMGLRKTSGLTYLSRGGARLNSSPRVSKIAEELETLKKTASNRVKETTRVLYRHHVSKSPDYVLKRWLTKKKDFKPSIKESKKAISNIMEKLSNLPEVKAIQTNKKVKNNVNISKLIYSSRVIQRATRKRLSVQGWTYCISGKSIVWTRDSDGYVSRKRPKPIAPRKPKSAKLLWEILRRFVRRIFDIARTLSYNDKSIFRQVFCVKYKISELEAKRKCFERCTTKDSKVYWYVCVCVSLSPPLDDMTV